MKFALLMLIFLFGTIPVGQSQSQPQPEQKPAEAPAAKPADVKSIDSIVAALYDVISGPAGQKRDWNRFRSLFWPGARLMPLAKPPDKPNYVVRMLTVEEFISRTEPFFAKEGFFESALVNHVDQWAQIAQVFSSYESRHEKGEKPFARGINSIQIFNDGQRWWVLNVFWEGESEQNPLPDHMLKSPGGKQ
jgi:hypothetical protein